MGKVVKKKKAVKSAPVEAVETEVAEVVEPVEAPAPAESERQPKAIGGKAIKSIQRLDNGNYHVVDVEGTGYTLPPSEYASLFR